MNLLAVSGSPRKGKSTETLINKAVEGAKAKRPDINITRVDLIDYDIKPCMNCLKCRDAVTNEPYVRCAMRDDMDMLYDLIYEADAYIMGNPLHSGCVTGLVSIFLERIVWCFAEPKGKVFGIKGIPRPRSPKERRLGIIITNATIPPILKPVCNDAGKQIKAVMKSCLNTRLTGDLYAGALETRGIETYLEKAFRLGEKLAS